MKTNSYITVACAAVAAALPAGLSAQSTPHESTPPVNAVKVDDKTVEQDLTAKDFIGSDVVDINGDKIGDISDISLGSEYAGVKSMNEQSEYSASDRREHSSADMRPTDHDSSMETSAEPISSSEAVVYISVGGVLGVGDDHIRVPATALDWNAGKKCFQLGINKDDLVALAKPQEHASTTIE